MSLSERADDVPGARRALSGLLVWTSLALGVAMFLTGAILLTVVI